MERARFEDHFLQSVQHSVAFARRLVRQSLPDAVVFRVYPNQSFDGQPRRSDEVVFPEESLSTLEDYQGPWSAEQIVAHLWRDGKVPEWIDVSVEAVLGGRTIIALRCCGRFTADERLYYYNDAGGIPPFGIKSPELPPRWKSVEASGRFDLDWRHRRPQQA
jgi:hypothetical protein